MTESAGKNKMYPETGGIKMEEIIKYILEQVQNLLAIDSPTGYTGV